MQGQLDKDPLSVSCDISRQPVLASDLKVVLIASFDPENPGALSGMPYSMMNALKAKGISILPISSEPASRRILRRMLGGAVRRRVRAILERLKAAAPPASQELNPAAERQRILEAARKQSLHAARAVTRYSPDLIFGCCISTVLYAFETTTPIVYFSDATPEIINDTYPVYRRKSAAYKAACDELETTALRHATCAVFASRRALRSATERYGLSSDNGFVIPMGANIQRADLGDASIRLDAPRRDDLQLCLVAADPERKQLDLAVKTAELLAKRGWHTKLHYIGPERNGACSSPVVEWAGQLTLTRRRDRRKLAELMARSHLMLLPSLGEAFGIAPCEAAQFGRPSVVSSAGGLPEVVLDDATGTVLSLDAGPHEYADAVERIAGDEGVYARMSAACRERADRELNWNIWADSMIRVFERAVAARRSVE